MQIKLKWINKLKFNRFWFQYTPYMNLFVENRGPRFREYSKEKLVS